MEIPFLGQTYPARTPQIASDRSINWYPEINQEDSAGILSLIGTPGLLLFLNTGVLPVRGMHVFNDLMYVVIAGGLYSINTGGTVSAILGTLATNTGKVTMKDNGLAAAGVGGNQLMITDGGNGYIYNVVTGVFSLIAGGGWPATGALSVEFLDGYFIINTAGAMSHYCSDAYDGLTWNALAMSPVSATPDNLLKIVNFHQQLLMIKENSTEIWYDTGTPTTQGSPFSRVSGAVIDFGIVAPHSAARGANTQFWLATQRNNDGGEFVGVVMMNGYTPTIISPPSINYHIGQFAIINDAFGFCYTMDGHTFYVLTFPTADWTIVYDANTQMWHEWSSYTGAPYATGRHLSNCYCYYAGKHYVGDYQTGNIYYLSSSYLDDNGDPICSVRIAQHELDKNIMDNIVIHNLVINLQSGVGLTGAVSTALGVDPKVELSWSNDGGVTYGGNYQADMGKKGNYKTMARWRRLGYARDRVFRLMISDPVVKRVIGGYMEVTGKTA